VLARRATALIGPSFGYRILARSLTSGPRSDALSSVRVAVNGSEPVREADVRLLNEIGARHGLDRRAMTFGFGLAEATLAVTLGSGHQIATFDWVDRHAFRLDGVVVPAPPHDPASMALAMCGHPIDDTTVVAGGTASAAPGPVLVSGPGVATGVGPLCDTGDVGYLRDGQLVICGRSKATIKVNGATLYAEDVEGVIEALPDVVPGGCVALDMFVVDGSAGLGLVIERRTPDVDPTAEVRQAIREGLGVELARLRLVERGQVPRTTSGKRRRWLCGPLLSEDT